MNVVFRAKASAPLPRKEPVIRPSSLLLFRPAFLLLAYALLALPALANPRLIAAPDNPQDSAEPAAPPASETEEGGSKAEVEAEPEAAAPAKKGAAPGLRSGLFASEPKPLPPTSKQPPGVTPRSTMQHFFASLRQGKLEAATDIFAKTQASKENLQNYAKRLKAILDTYLWVELGELSDQPAGRLDDGLAPNLEELGVLNADGEYETLYLYRQSDGVWVLPPETLGLIDRWYPRLPDHWIREHLPQSLLKQGPYELPRWQWLAIPLFALFCLALGVLLGRLSLALGRFFVRHTVARWDDLIIERLYTPFVLFISVLAGWIFLPALSLPIPARALALTFLQTLALAAFFWALLRLVDFLGELIRSTVNLDDRPQLRALLPMGSRILKITVAAVAAVAVLQQLGFPVASIIAGLGIGGLAVALAAQKTVENFIGSMTLSVDQPFRPGDFVNIGGLLGTVESVGIRSSRIRTLSRTLVTIPNAKLAEEQIESFSMRDRLLLNPVIRVSYGTTSAQLRQIVKEIEELLYAHPLIFSEAVRVVFKEITPAGLEIEIFTWLQETDWTRFLYQRQEILWDIMAIVERNGSSLALPTQILHVDGKKGPMG